MAGISNGGSSEQPFAVASVAPPAPAGRLPKLHSMASAMSGVFEEGGAYQVRLNKEDGEGKFGIAYRATQDGLAITGFVTNGAADKWNRAADTDRSICVGDIITAVNSVKVVEGAFAPEDAGCSALVEALVSGPDICRLTIQKFGPRWHIQGVTAECMEKIQIAEEAGIRLELVLDNAALIQPDEKVNEADLKTLTRTEFFTMLGVVAAPSALVLAVCSALGVGFDLFAVFADEMMNMYGNAIIFAFFNILVGMYIVDWHKWESKWQRVVTALIVIYGMCFGGIVKCRFYPQAPLVIFLFHIPVFMGMLRATAFRAAQRASFYRSVALSTFLVGVMVLVVWLSWMNIPGWDGVNLYNDATKAKLVERSSMLYAEFKPMINGRERSLDYEWDCKEQRNTDFDLIYGETVDNGYTLEISERQDRAVKCGQVNLIWFLLWVSPFVVVMVNWVLAVFCAINGTIVGLDDMSRAEKALKQFILMIAILFLCMWVAASVAGASMRLTGALMAFCGSALIALFIWIYFEVGAKLLASTLKQSKMMKSLLAIVTNDWFRACFVMGFNAGLPAMLCVEVVRQRVRRLRGTTTSTDLLTHEAYAVIEMLKSWRWGSIFVKVNWLVILYWTLSVGVAKITIIFLSWLNEELSQIPLIWVCVIFFGIGYVMFLLPPVPGIPVYITSGIIIAAQSRSIDEVGGYWGGVVIATALSFVLKIAAVCGQYSIGYFMGKSVKVQQLVMVDKVPTRAIEKILLRRGLNAAKVAVLVGGPDWPTSVLCGILRLNLFQCCLGTVPVIFVSAPCVLAGAFLAGPSSDMTQSDKNVWDALANTALAVSALGQLASGVCAMYFIQDTITKHSDELSEHREEHQKVKELTQAEEAYNDCYGDVIDWKNLSRPWLALISTSAVMMIISFFLFLLFDEVCFREFKVNNSISDPEGLDCSGNFGCAMVRIVREDPPIGWGALGLFAMACLLHFIFLRYVGRKAKALHKCREADGLLVDADVTTV